MAPRGAIAGSHGVATRRMRKRQSRHAGKTCKGCTAVDSSVGACQMFTVDGSKEVISTMQNAGIEWRTYFLTTAPKPVEAKIGEYPDRPASLMNRDAVGPMIVADRDVKERVNSSKEASGPFAAHIHTKALELAEVKSEELSKKASSLPLACDSTDNEETEASQPDTCYGHGLCETNIEESEVRSMFAAPESVPVLAAEEKEEEEAAAPECSPLSRRHQKHVHFNLEATSIHEVVRYAEIYGTHPRTFVFDRDSNKIPAAKGGYVSAASMIDDDYVSAGEEIDDSDDSDSDEDEDDGDWESWLLEQEDEDDSDYSLVPAQVPLPDLLEHENSDYSDDSLATAQVPLQDDKICLEGRFVDMSESERESSMELTHGTCLQALDEVKSLYACKYGHSIDEEVVQEDGINFSVTRGAPPSMAPPPSPHKTEWDFIPALTSSLEEGTCLPALDDRTGWELWLEATLGSTQEDLFYESL